MEAARARLLLLATPMGPYQADIAAMAPDQRLRMLAAFEAAAASRHDIGAAGLASNGFMRRLAAGVLGRLKQK